MSTATLVPEYGSANPARPHGDHLSLADALDRILHRGVSLQGNLTIGLADVDLLFLDLRLLLGSIDAIWPDGRSPLAPIRPNAPSAAPCASSPSAETSLAARRPGDSSLASVAATAAASAPARLTSGSSEPASSTAQGLVRLVLTLVKLLHEVLQRQAVRRMEAGRLSEAQIENVGAALSAQAEEILRLQRQFGFADKDLSLDLGVPDGAL